jgi:hypothetical protein
VVRQGALDSVEIVPKQRSRVGVGITTRVTKVPELIIFLIAASLRRESIIGAQLAPVSCNP